MMKIMFGATEPDLRSLSDEGKVWFGELASTVGSDAAVRGIALAEHAGTADIRAIGGGEPHSGG